MSHNIFNDLISDTHDEPDHDDDLAPARGIVNGLLLSILAVASIVFGACVVAFAVANL